MILTECCKGFKGFFYTFLIYPYTRGKNENGNDMIMIFIIFRDICVEPNYLKKSPFSLFPCFVKKIETDFLQRYTPVIRDIQYANKYRYSGKYA